MKKLRFEVLNFQCEALSHHYSHNHYAHFKIYFLKSFIVYYNISCAYLIIIKTLIDIIIKIRIGIPGFFALSMMTYGVLSYHIFYLPDNLINGPVKWN